MDRLGPLLAFLALFGTLASQPAHGTPVGYNLNVQWDGGTPVAAAFVGSFTWDTGSGALTELSGTLTDAAGAYGLPFQFGVTQFGIAG